MGKTLQVIGIMFFLIYGVAYLNQIYNHPFGWIGTQPVELDLFILWNLRAIGLMFVGLIIDKWK